VNDVMFSYNRRGKGDANRACSQNDSPGSRTRGEVAKYDVYDSLFTSETPGVTVEVTIVCV